MTEEYKIAWTIYASGVLILLAAGWWFMRNWGWAWLRYSLLLITASVLLVPAQGTFPGGPPAPVLPLFVYQTLFEDGATPQVATNLVFAAAGALAVLLIWGLIVWALARRRDRELLNSEPFFDD